jgi:hypothetical protein
MALASTPSRSTLIAPRLLAFEDSVMSIGEAELRMYDLSGSRASIEDAQLRVQ